MLTFYGVTAPWWAWSPGFIIEGLSLWFGLRAASRWLDRRIDSRIDRQIDVYRRLRGRG